MRASSLPLIGTFAALLLGASPAAHAQEPPAQVQKATNGIALGQGKGLLIRLPRPVTDMFVADPKVADVQVKSSTQVYVFGVGGGETTIYATDARGKVVYSANVRVGVNIDSVKSMLGLAMPGAAIEVTPLNGMVLLTGTVASPSEVEEAERLVGSFLGGANIVNKLKTALPMQVNLQVKIAEVSRDLVRELGVNLLTRDQSGGFLFGISRGRAAATITGNTTFAFTPPTTGATALNFAGRLAGLDIAAALDLLENDGAVTLLAEPNLTALSGETASFLAGGEFPIAVSSGIGATTIGVQGIWRRPRLHADRARRQPYLDARPARGVRAVGRGRDPDQRHVDPRDQHAPRRDDGGARLGPELHDRRAAAQRFQQLDREDADARRSADPRRAVQVGPLPPQRNRAGDRHHPLSREAGGRPSDQAADRRRARAERPRPLVSRTDLHRRQRCCRPSARHRGARARTGFAGPRLLELRCAR